MTRREDLQDDHSVERELLARYREQRDEALRDLDDAKARAERYEKAVIGLEAVLPDEETEIETPVDDDPTAEPTAAAPVSSVPTNGSAPHGREPRGEAAVAAILKEVSEPGLTAAELTAALALRGWTPKSENPENAVRAAANRLRKKDPSIRFVAGKYFYRSNDHVSAFSLRLASSERE